MKICTFFGHRDTPEDIRHELKQVLIDLIENKGVQLFYVWKTSGGARKFKELAQRKNKTVINLCKEG